MVLKLDIFIIDPTSLDSKLKKIIQPDEVITWIDVNGNEEMSRLSSWYNKTEANVCGLLCNELKKIAPHKSIAIVTLYKNKGALSQII